MDALPPRTQAIKENTGERVYRTALSSRDYLLFEREAIERGISPYILAKTILTMYLHNKLFLVAELPADLQAQIETHFKKK